MVLLLFETEPVFTCYHVSLMFHTIDCKAVLKRGGLGKIISHMFTTCI